MRILHSKTISVALKVHVHERMLATAYITSPSTAKHKQRNKQTKTSQQEASTSVLARVLYVLQPVCEVFSSRNLPSTSGMQVKSVVITFVACGSLRASLDNNLCRYCPSLPLGLPLNKLWTQGVSFSTCTQCFLWFNS